MATLSSSLVKKLVSVTNDSSSTATSSGTAYGTVTVSGDRTYVLIDGGTTITPVVAGADARDQDRVIVTIENHTATITSNLTNPASSYTASETEEAITDYLTDESEDGYLSVVGAYIGDLTVDTAYIDTLLANYVKTETLEADYASITYLETEYLSAVEAYIGNLQADSIVVTNLLASYATIDYLEGTYLEYVEGYIGTLTSDYITTEYLTTNYLTASTIDAQYADIKLLNVGTESVKNLFVSVGVLTDATIEDAYITGMLNGVRINADVITAGTLSVDRLLVTGADSIVYEINATSSGLTATELEDETYQSYLHGNDIAVNSITASRIAAGTITANEIDTTNLAASEAFLTTLTAQTAFIDAIETNTVVVGAVTTAEAAIANQEILYTTTSSATTTPDSTAEWSTVQPDKVSGVYIWMKIINTYGNGTTYTSTPVCISGLDGEDGISGASVAISASTVSYAISTSGSTVPTSGWTETLPTASNGQYLWTRTEITYELTDADGNTTNKTTTSYGVSYIGVDGADGTSVDISSSSITYCVSTNGTTAPTSGTWTTTIPSVSNGQYLWTKTEITYNTGDTTTSYSVSYIGVDGENGTDGIGITSVANYYALSTSGSVSPTSWSTDVLEMTLTNRYLWNYETKYYSDGSSDSTTPHVIGVYGATGANGEDGVGISGIVEYYAVSSSSSTAPTTWYTTLQTMTVTYKYLWNYETVTYTNGTTEDSIARVIGVYGNTGSKGDTGDAGADGSSVTINSTEISYIASSSGTTTPSGTWSTSIPSVSNGQYLWTRTVVVYYLTASDGTLTTETTTSYSVAYIGTNGADGVDGEDGTSVSIASTTISYCASSSGTTAPSGTWSTSVPSVSQGQYLWTRTVVTYSTGDTTTSYGVSYIGTDGQDGEDGQDGADGTTLYATCSTAASTATKIATITPTKSGFELTEGTIVSVKFTYTNTASNPTLNVNGTGAKAIYYQGAAITASYIVASMILTFCYDGSYWQYTGYVNTTSSDSSQYSASVYASSAITAGNIIVGNSSGYHQLNAGTSFDISYPILYAGSSISSGSTGTNNYTEINFTVTTTQSITLTAYKYVYIKGTLSASTFTPSSTAPLTQTVPTTSDGLYYICLGLAYSTTGIRLEASHEMFCYYQGTFQSLGANAQRIIAAWCYNENETFIDGGNIYTGTINTEQLAASCITTEQLASNCITADKISIGIGGNLYSNYDTFEQITDAYITSYTKSSYATVTITSDEAYYGTQCLSLYNSSTSNSTAYVYLGHSSNGYGCVPIGDAYYRISCYVKSSSTSTVVLRVARHTARNSTVSAYTTVSATATTEWTRISVLLNGSTYYSTYPFISVGMSNNTSGTYAYFDAIQIEEVATATTEAGEFNVGGMTTINGGNLVTGSVTADSIDVNSIFACSITFTGSIYSTGTDANGDTFEVYVLPGTNTNGDYLVVHNVTDGTYPFYVRSDGSMVCTSATITGVITAGSGSTIGGWTCTGGKIYGGTSSTGVAVMQVPQSSTSYVFAAGGTSHTSYASCPFRVTKTGILYAENAVLAGSVYLYDDANSTNVEAMYADGGVMFPTYCYFESGALFEKVSGGYSLETNGAIYITGASTLASTLAVTGATTLNSTLTVSSTTKFNGTTYAYGSLYGYASHTTYSMFGAYYSSTNGYTCRIGYSTSYPVDLMAVYATTINWRGVANFTAYSSTYSNSTYGEYQFGTSTYTCTMGLYGTLYYTGSLTYTSDERLKTNWIDVDKYDTFFDSLNPQAYQYTYESSGKYHLGFGAQSVLKALMSCGLTEDDFAGITYHTGEAGSGKYFGYDDSYGLSYTEFIALIVYEVQQLKAKVQVQAAEIEVLQAQLAA